jgi:hypothetical protein
LRPKVPKVLGKISFLSLEVLGQIILTDVHRFSGYLPLTKFSKAPVSLPGEGSVRTNGGRASVHSENCFVGLRAMTIGPPK